MTPPDLPGDAPVLNVFHPGEIGIAPAFGNDPDIARADRPQRGFRQRFDVDEPLRREIRLNSRLAAIANPNGETVGLGLFQETLIP